MYAPPRIPPRRKRPAHTRPPGSQVDPSIAEHLAGGGAPPTQQDVAAATAQKEQQDQMRADMLARLLSGDAKERLNRIALVKPDKARKLEEMVRAAARSSKLGCRRRAIHVPLTAAEGGRRTSSTTGLPAAQ